MYDFKLDKLRVQEDKCQKQQVKTVLRKGRWRKAEVIPLLLSDEKIINLAQTFI